LKVTPLSSAERIRRSWPASPTSSDTSTTHSDAGPFDLLIKQAATREALKTGSVAVKIEPNGNDTWRFNFFLDLLSTTART
jgi:hypothetical protein